MLELTYRVQQRTLEENNIKPREEHKYAWLTMFKMSWTSLTYGPRKAVAEVSNHNEPIGRRSGTQLVGKSMDFTFNCFVLN